MLLEKRKFFFITKKKIILNIYIFRPEFAKETDSESDDNYDTKTETRETNDLRTSKRYEDKHDDRR